MNILQLLLLLRQACCHPMLVKEAAAKAALQAIKPFEKENRPPDGLPAAADALTDNARNRLKEGNVDAECPICLDVPDADEALITRCGHSFCRTCLYAAVGLDDSNPMSRGLCPSCRRQISPADCLKKSALLPPPPPPPHRRPKRRRLRRRRKSRRRRKRRRKPRRPSPRARNPPPTRPLRKRRRS
eukprot:Opistho-1_new@40504